ncbi:MAG: hypothetical protein WCI57_02910 [Candidatus Berkelbacteria bacterium]
MKSKFYCFAAPPLFLTIIQDTNAVVCLVVALFALFVLARLIINIFRKKKLFDQIVKIALVLIFFGFICFANIDMIFSSYSNYYLGYYLLAVTSSLSIFIISKLAKNKKIIWLLILPIISLIFGVVTYFGIKNNAADATGRTNESGFPLDTSPTASGTSDLQHVYFDLGCGQARLF